MTCAAQQSTLTKRKKFTFTGKEDVTVDIVSATSTIQIHANELSISKASFKGSGEGSKELQAVSVSINFKRKVATIAFPEELAVGEGKALQKGPSDIRLSAMTLKAS